MPTPKIQRQTIEIDAAEQTLGRLSSKIAFILIGKHKADYLPNKDAGDFVKITNAAAIRITGTNKPAQKKYYRHSMHGGGLKAESLQLIMKQDPSEAIRRAVSKMLPKNRLRTERIKRLIISN